jgi:hypothetical protein
MRQTDKALSGNSEADGEPDRKFWVVLTILRRRTIMLWTIFVVLGILWLLGFSLHIGGGLIHLLLVVALVVLVINLLSGRRGIA